MQVISGHLGWVRSIAFDPGNEWFCTGSADRTIKVIASAIMVSTSQFQCVHSLSLLFYETFAEPILETGMFLVLFKRLISFPAMVCPDFKHLFL